MELNEATPAASSPSPPASMPRSRPVARAVGGYFTAALLGLAGIVVMGVVLAAVNLAGTGDATSTPSGAAAVVLMAVPLQLALLVVGILFARRPGECVRQRLGLVRPSFSVRTWAILLGAVGVPFALALGAAMVMPSSQDPHVILQLWKNLSPLGAVGWVVFIGVTPGICEEVFFRGFMQRELLKAWKPAVAIPVTAVLFGIMHLDPATIALAVVMGLWLGWVSWRTGSILPTIAMHAAVNSFWNAAQIIAQKSDIPPHQAWIGVGVLGAVSLVCFVLAVPILTSRSMRMGREGGVGGAGSGAQPVVAA